MQRALVPDAAAQWISDVLTATSSGHSKLMTQYGGDQANFSRHMQRGGLCVLTVSELKSLWRVMQSKRFVKEHPSSSIRLRSGTKKDDLITHVMQFFYDPLTCQPLTTDDLCRPSNGSSNSQAQSSARQHDADMARAEKQQRRNVFTNMHNGMNVAATTATANMNPMNGNLNGHYNGHFNGHNPIFCPNPSAMPRWMNAMGTSIPTIPASVSDSRMSHNRVGFDMEPNFAANNSIDNDDFSVNPVGPRWMDAMSTNIPTSPASVSDSRMSHHPMGFDIEPEFAANNNVNNDEYPVNLDFNPHRLFRAAATCNGPNRSPHNPVPGQGSTARTPDQAYQQYVHAQVQRQGRMLTEMKYRQQKKRSHKEHTKNRKKIKIKPDPDRFDESRTPKNHVEVNLVSQMRGMGFTDTKEILMAIRKHSGVPSPDQIMLDIISQREESEEARKMDEARLRSEEERKAQSRQRRKMLELEEERRMEYASTQTWLSDKKMFSGSWILSNKEVEDHLNDLLPNNSTMTTKRKVLQLLKLEKKSRQWYGKKLPMTYFMNVICPDILQSTTRQSLDKLFDRLITVLNEALYKLSEQQGGVPKLFLDLKDVHQPTYKPDPSENGGCSDDDDDDEVLILDEEEVRQLKQENPKIKSNDQVEVIEIL